MRFYNENKRELKDGKIIAALKQALKDYEDGAIIECRDTISDIEDAINAFEDDQEKTNNS